LLVFILILPILLLLLLRWRMLIIGAFSRIAREIRVEIPG